MVTIKSLAKEIEQIKQRNKKVELDKKWETSIPRKILLFLFTYLSIGFYMYAIKLEKPWLNAMIPSIGFLLSTLTLPLFKDLWMKKHKS